MDQWWIEFSPFVGDMETSKCWTASFFGKQYNSQLLREVPDPLPFAVSILS
jgi:hypothetical protein